MLQHDVHGEPMQPRRERALAAKRLELFPRANEDVLHEVARLAFVSDHAPAERVDRRRVRAIHRLERVHVALLRAPDDVVDLTVVARCWKDVGGSAHPWLHHARGPLARYRLAALASMASISRAVTGRGSSIDDPMAVVVGTRDAGDVAGSIER